MRSESEKAKLTSFSNHRLAGYNSLLNSRESHVSALRSSSCIRRVTLNWICQLDGSILVAKSCEIQAVSQQKKVMTSWLAQYAKRGKQIAKGL